MKGLRQQSLPYLIALAVIGAALLLRIPLYPLLGGSRPYLTLFGGVAIAVWFARWKPAAIAAAIGFVLANYFLAATENTFAFNAFFVSEFTVYALSAGFIIFVGETLHRARDRAL